ncbi:histidine kinase [Burkholderiaceae bacterium DAT-1]|nr:histidine kinase [Burkholderiaceae bacterium DAT-1]
MNQPLPQALPDVLPDFRNLGVVLRSILAMNALFALGCLIGAVSTEAALQRFMLLAGLFEPVLLFSLGLLALVRDALLRLAYRQGVVATILMVMLVTLMICMIGRDVYQIDIKGYFCAIAWSTLSAMIMLRYFRLRGRAMSPLLAEARLQALQARIRPHFLFNAINAVLSLIRSQPRQAERALEDLSDLFRVFMAENRELVLLSREVELAQQYMGLEKLRLGDRLMIEWHIDKMPADAMIPPLILQPLLENAVYHGIEPSIQPGCVTVNVYLVRDEVHLDIRNPYFKDGGQHHAGNKMAMANIRERLFLHFDAEANLKTSVGVDYYQVHLMLPYRVAKRIRDDRLA